MSLLSCRYRTIKQHLSNAIFSEDMREILEVYVEVSILLKELEGNTDGG